MLDGELKKTKFSDLPGEPLGSVPSIIFWSDQQVKLINNITNMKHKHHDFEKVHFIPFWEGIRRGHPRASEGIRSPKCER